MNNKKKIYTATSWKNEKQAKTLTNVLRHWGHQVYCFANTDMGQFNYWWPDIVMEHDNGITGLWYQESKIAYANDKKYLNWANTCILINPCGRDAHLEAGFIKGKGGKLYIIGEFPTGEFSNMYHMADKLFKFNLIGLNQLKEELEK